MIRYVIIRPRFDTDLADKQGDRWIRNKFWRCTLGNLPKGHLEKNSPTVKVGIKQLPAVMDRISNGKGAPNG